jgi:signal transduction histidine kinase
MGYINQRLGDFSGGLSQLLTARGLFEQLEMPDSLADVFDGLASVYWQAGDMPEALKHAQWQLETAYQSGDMRRVANAYNNLGVIFSRMGDQAQAVTLFQENLQRAAKLNSARIEFLSCGNLSSIYTDLGNYPESLAYALRALDVSQRAGYELFEAHALHLIGRAHTHLGHHVQARAMLEQGLQVTRRLGARVTEASLLYGVAETYLAVEDLDGASNYLQQCLDTAEAVDEKTHQVRAHLLLSQVCERKGDLWQALTHLQKHIALNEIVFGENANQRFRVLQVTHDVETARKEAEIVQLESRQLQQEIAEQRKVESALQAARDDLERQVEARTAELSDTVLRLKKEVAERERAEAEIHQVVNSLELRVASRTEELAALFDLTLLAGQATTLDVIFEKSLPRIIEVMRSDAICVHRLCQDGDCEVLRLVAEQGLENRERALVADVALPSGIREWLQGPSTPVLLTASTDVTQAGPPFYLQDYGSYLGAQIRIAGRPDGLMSYFRRGDRGFGLDEVALGTALAEQMGIILETYRLREETEAVAVLQERQRLARDLHDSVTQSLYSLSLFSRAGREAAEDGDKDRLSHSLAELERNTLHTLREMRLLLYELRPADLAQEGLTRAIELRLNSVERRANVRVEVALDDIPTLPVEVEVNLYRIVEEALNNVVKHTTATCVSLELKRVGRDLRLCLTDDGQGFDPTLNIAGMGLRNIRERAGRLGGQVSIRSQHGSGTRVEVTIPDILENEHERTDTDLDR